jgi:hypothetical protein
MLEVNIPPTCCPGLDTPKMTEFDIILIAEIINIINSTDHICKHGETYGGCDESYVYYVNFFRRVIFDSCVVMISIEVRLLTYLHT